MTNYLSVNLQRSSFLCSADFYLLDRSFSKVKVKIDTGCGFSVIPYNRLIRDDVMCRDLKAKDIRNKVKSMQSYGVETGGVAHKKPKTFEDKLSCSALKFSHQISWLSLNGYILPDFDVDVNYDRLGNILIGMDILSQFDIHIGLSNVTNNVVLLGVLKTQKDKTEYNKALFRHFGLVREETLLADGLRQVFKDIKDEG